MKRACLEQNTNTYEQNHASANCVLKMDFVWMKSFIMLSKQLLSLTIILFLNSSCETEIKDLEPYSANAKIADYEASPVTTDSIFSEVFFLRYYIWDVGPDQQYSFVQDNYILTFKYDGNYIYKFDIDTKQFSSIYYDKAAYIYNGTYAYAGKKILYAGGYTSVPYNKEYSILQETDKVNIYCGEVCATARLSKVRKELTAASLGNLIFFAGGRDTSTYFSSNVIDIYNVTTDKWTTARLSIPRSNMAAISSGDKVFFAGGEISNYNYEVGDSGLTDQIDIYDAKIGKWNTDRLSIPRRNVLAAAVGNKVYFIGGVSSNGIISDVIDVFDIKTNNWSIIKMNTAKLYSKCLVAGNLIFFTENDFNVKTVDYYNTITEKWTTMEFTPKLLNKGYEIPCLIAYKGNKLYLKSNYKLYEYELK
jgi:hypothetical protein